MKTPIEDLPAKRLTKDMILSPQKSGMSEEDYINAFLKEFNAEMGKPVVFQDVIGDPIVISEDFFRGYNVLRSEIYLPMLADTIKDPVEIWLARVDEIKLSKRYIGIYNNTGKIVGYAIFELIDNVWRGTTMYDVGKIDLDYLDRQRAEFLLYQK